MNEKDTKFVIAAYDYRGKLIDKDSFIAEDEADIRDMAEDIEHFMYDVVDQVGEGAIIE